ncbi:phospholipid transfer protein C2CD2L isoform X1 [Petromyzon marinus]|uniref:phospholipid transfer protein C2CD2L isoform X1 n=1 Tax=Petromyzon marinus TaxID=7757 RepID=UPI003F6F19FA
MEQQLQQEVEAVPGDEAIPGSMAGVPGSLDLSSAQGVTLLLLFAASALTVLAWLAQYLEQGGGRRRHLPPPLLLRLLPRGLLGGAAAGPRSRLGGVADPASLVAGLAAVPSWGAELGRAWLRALNEQHGHRHGSSLQIAFEEDGPTHDALRLSNVTYGDGQSDSNMALVCDVEAESVSFGVSVSQHPPAPVALQSLTARLAPLSVQLVLQVEEVSPGQVLLTWKHTTKPQGLSLTLVPRGQREGAGGSVDVPTVTQLVKDAILGAQPAVLLTLSPYRAAQGGGVKPDGLVTSPPKPPRLVDKKLLLRIQSATGAPAGAGELCCHVEMNEPPQQHRTRPVPGAAASPSWEQSFCFDLNTRSREIRLRLLDTSKGKEAVCIGRAAVPLDVGRALPSGRHTLTLLPPTASPTDRTPSPLAAAANVTLELCYQEGGEARSPGPLAASVRPAATPSKKVEMERTVMADGTVVTTVTTLQTRAGRGTPSATTPFCVGSPRAHACADSPARSPVKVTVTEKSTVQEEVPAGESQGGATAASAACTDVALQHNGLDAVAETAIRQLTESALRNTKATPTKRSTLIISGVSKMPLIQDEAALSQLYSMNMDGDDAGPSPLPHHYHHHPAATTSSFSSLPSSVQQLALCGPQSPSAANSTGDSLLDAATAAAAATIGAASSSPAAVAAGGQPSMSDADSERGSTVGFETGSLKEHKAGFLHGGLFRRRHRKKKDAGLSQSHNDLPSMGPGHTLVAGQTQTLGPGLSHVLAKHRKTYTLSRLLSKRFKAKHRENGKTAAP